MLPYMCLSMKAPSVWPSWLMAMQREDNPRLDPFDFQKYFRYYTSTVNYTCNEGYYFLDGEETVASMCLENGQWSNITARCQGNLDTLWKSYVWSAKFSSKPCKLYCTNAYWLTLPSNPCFPDHCQTLLTVLSLLHSLCDSLVVNCGKVPDREGASCSTDGTSYPANATCTCNSGYERVEEDFYYDQFSSTNRLTTKSLSDYYIRSCQSSGEWSDPWDGEYSSNCTSEALFLQSVSFDV